METKKAQKKTVEVVAMILIHNKLVFATQRGYGEFKDMWEFPGGSNDKTPSDVRERPIFLSD